MSDPGVAAHGQVADGILLKKSEGAYTKQHNSEAGATNLPDFVSSVAAARKARQINSSAAGLGYTMQAKPSIWHSEVHEAVTYLILPRSLLLVYMFTAE